MKKKLNLLKKFEHTDKNFLIFLLLLAFLVSIISLVAYTLRTPLPKSEKLIGKTPTYESGYLIRYLDKQVAIVMIRVNKDDPKEKANDLFISAKAAIEKSDVLRPKKIVHTVPLKPIDSSTEENITIEKFVIIVQPIEPNFPS